MVGKEADAPGSVDRRRQALQLHVVAGHGIDLKPLIVVAQAGRRRVEMLA